MSEYMNGFDIVEDVEHGHWHVVPHHDHSKILATAPTMNEAKLESHKVLSSFYGIAEDFAQKLSEGVDKMGDKELILMEELVEIITMMKHSEKPRYFETEYDDFTVKAADFSVGSPAYITYPYLEPCEGVIVDVIYRSDDVDRYDGEEMLDSKTDYDFSCEFVTDDDCVFVFVKRCPLQI